MLFSQRLTVENVTPTLAANCSCVKPRVIRRSLIILEMSFLSPPDTHPPNDNIATAMADYMLPMIQKFTHKDFHYFA